MCRLIIAVVFCFISKGVFSAGDVIISGGKPAGMGYAAVAGTGLWSVCNNPAGMAFTNGFRAGIYAENRFLLPDLTTGTIAITFGSRPGTFGGYVNHFGGALYSELKAAAGYARKFGKRFAAGVLIDYLGIAQAEGYGNKSLVSFEAGLMCRPDDKWSVGVHLLNPVPISITDDKSEKLPVVFRAGFSRVFAKKAEVAAEIESTSHEKAVVRIGLEYIVHRSFFLRTGFVSNPQTVTAGIGLAFGNLHIDLGSSWQPVLGYSAQISLEYHLRVKSEK
jgi:hypothetical protein